ncbi:peptidase [Brachybacterium vulturis]|uniref:Peptidase n=1 Tax=Brachybacterium vulturis TaxID=2017484 RepID=A0A291GNP5_9MICO|nr:M23 family metallopeptidase [Brachybacterium vulturis]ATG51851.1 peptidase [Brachybacterium vulturis]
MSSGGPLVLALPFRGRWKVQNSPADRVPSHGTAQFALAHSIDLVPVDEHGRTAPFGLRSLVLPEPPEAFPGFGREALSPVDGVIHSLLDSLDDHHAGRGLPSIGFALTQRRRAAAGWTALAGNHVILRARHRGTEVYVALCHLRRGSVTVRPGQEIRVGAPLGSCGNSGNSTEPHLHLQAMSAADPSVARAVPFTLPDGLPRGGQVVDGG